MSKLLLAAAAIVAATAAATFASTLADPAATRRVASLAETSQCQAFVSDQGIACNPFGLRWTGAQAHYAVPREAAAPARVAEQHS